MTLKQKKYIFMNSVKSVRSFLNISNQTFWFGNLHLPGAADGGKKIFVNMSVGYYLKYASRFFYGIFVLANPKVHSPFYTDRSIMFIFTWLLALTFTRNKTKRMFRNKKKKHNSRAVLDYQCWCWKYKLIKHFEIYF